MTPEAVAATRAALGGRVLLLNGYPGSGKRTVGAILAERLKGRLLDNHAIIDAAMAVHHPSEEAHWPLRRAVEGLVLRAARALPADVPIVATGVVFDEQAHDLAAIAALDRLSRARGAPTAVVNLVLDEGENARRLTSPGREGTRKLRDPLTLAAIRHRYDLLDDPIRKTLRVDVGELAPEAAADAVLDAVAAFLEKDARRGDPLPRAKPGTGRRRP